MATGAPLIDPDLKSLLKRMDHIRLLAVIIRFSDEVDMPRQGIQSLIRENGGEQIVVLWIINGIAAKIPAQAVYRIVSLVKSIRLDASIEVPKPPAP